jgi:hypothetical protein
MQLVEPKEAAMVTAVTATFPMSGTDSDPAITTAGGMASERTAVVNETRFSEDIDDESGASYNKNLGS